MFAFFKNIENIFAMVKQAVKIAEESTASGEQKREAALTLVLQLAKDIGLDLTPYKDLIGNIIDGVVFTYNLLHVFEHHDTKKG